MSHESTQSSLWFCLDSKPPEFYPPKTSQHFKAIIAPHPFGKLTATELWSCGSSWLWGMCGVCCRAMLLSESKNLKQHVFRNIRTRTWYLLTLPCNLPYSFLWFVSKIFWGFGNAKVSLKATDIFILAQDSTLFRDLLKASWDDKASAKDLCSVAISLAKLRCLVCMMHHIQEWMHHT